MREELDRFGVERAGISLDDDPELARAALADAPRRLFGRSEADPRRGMQELRRIECLAREGSLRAVTLSPARRFLPVDHAYCAPLFAKCVELDLTVCPSLGVPEERVPFAPQKVERIDPVACFFPELRIVMRGGCEPWQALAVLLMQRHANLFFAGCELPDEVTAFANEAGHHQVLFASDSTALEGAAKGIPALALSKPAWPRFLRDNAVRVFRL
jgi:predicted TIM-barrel fold metal-dependent hydrolase